MDYWWSKVREVGGDCGGGVAEEGGGYCGDELRWLHFD